MILFGWRQGHPGTRWIEQMESYSSVLELIVLAVIAATIWCRARGLERRLGRDPALGVGVLGIVTPIVLYARPRAWAATFPLRRSWCWSELRAVVILSSEAI